MIEFAYDGLSRRIRKKVTEGVSTIAVWEAYVYDGWNMVLSVKLNPAAGATQGRPQSAIASNVWAPDLGSQPFARRDWQKAGGVRGLVLANYFTGANGGGIHVPGMDPMGNVTSVTRLGMSYSAGESPGPYFRSEFVYDYDAFGKETRSSTLVAGLNPDSFPFHFSTKFTDPESGFNYYGYRFYDPANGRWINRDPIGELGGENIYSMVANNTVQMTDYFGLDYMVFQPKCVKCDAKSDSKLHNDASGKYTPGNLILCGDDGEEKDRWNSNSGGYKDKKSKVKGDDTRIAPGDYDIGDPHSSKMANANRDGQNFFYPLTPSSGNPTPQTDLGIHPDGGFPGTHGCTSCDEDASGLKRLKNTLNKKNKKGEKIGPKKLTALPDSGCKSGTPCKDAQNQNPDGTKK